MLKGNLFDSNQVEFVKLIQNDSTSFDCGEQELNEYLTKDAFKDTLEKRAITTLVLYSNCLAGYFTTAIDTIKIDRQVAKKCGLRYNEWPAVKIACFLQVGIPHYCKLFSLAPIGNFLGHNFT